MDPTTLLAGAAESLTVSQVADLMKVSRSTIYNWISQGEEGRRMPAYRWPGGWRIDREKLREWLNARHN